MSVQIGQFRKDQLSNYTIDKPILSINNEVKTITNTQNIVNNAKLDFSASPSDTYPKYFQENQIYYIPKIILKLDGFDNNIFKKQSIKVDAILKEDDFEQTIATFSFSSCGEQSYDISFVPTRKCSELHFKVRRNTNELSNAPGSLSIFDSDEFITIENKVNLLTTSSMADINWIQKLGVQAAPGFTFIVNGELIRVGKSGTYMISDINIDSLAAVIRKDNQELMNNPIPFNENSDYFLLDYEYIKEV